MDVNFNPTSNTRTMDFKTTIKVGLSSGGLICLWIALVLNIKIIGPEVIFYLKGLSALTAGQVATVFIYMVVLLLFAVWYTVFSYCKIAALPFRKGGRLWPVVSLCYGSVVVVLIFILSGRPVIWEDLFDWFYPVILLMVGVGLVRWINFKE